MLTKSKAIVLNSVKYGDRKVFVSLYTEEYGTISVSYSHSARGKKSPMANHMQPLSIVEVEFEYRPTASIHALRGARTVYPTVSIHADAFKLSIALFVAEVLRYSLSREQKNEALFQFIEQSIEWLDVADRDFANFHIILFARMCQLLGFRPYTDAYTKGACFDLLEGAFVTTRPNHGHVINAEQAALIPVVMRLNYNTMSLLRLNRKERNSCTETLLEYYRLHLPDFPEIKSLEVLKQLF